MSFIAPLFLLGALAVALPVLFHLIRRATRERTVFSSLIFLSPTPPRLTRRSRLEHLLLLLLRCAVLCLLAFAFARPFFRKAVTDDRPSTGGRRIVVLVDTSASMRRANLWADARTRVESILRKTAPSDQVAVLAFDRQTRPVFSFEQWNAAPAGDRAAVAAGKLSDVSPGWSATHLGSALIAAAEMLADTGGKAASGPARIVVVSDLQEGSRLEGLQGYEWPKAVELSLEPLKAKRPGNAALQLVTASSDADSKTADQVRVRVTNSADSKREQFKVGWGRPDGRGFAGEPSDVYVPPGQSRIIALPAPAAGIAADRITLQGDDEDFDNTVFVLPPETAKLSVLYVGADAEKDPKQPLYFLQRAFQETRQQAVRVLVHAPGTPIADAEARAATLLIADDALPAERAHELREQVIAGKTLLFALRSEAAVATLARVLQIDPLTATETRPANYTLLAEIDFRHPLFAPFADPRFSDFTKIHFWKYRRLDPAAIPGARSVAKFDGGDPAILEVPAGKGRVLVLTSGWQPDDSQLALSTKFVPMLYALLDDSGAPAVLPAQFQIGDAVPLAPTAGAAAAPLRIQLPDASEVTLAANETNFTQTVAPGIYTVASAQPPKRFAVNLDAAESRTAPLPADEFERLGAPVMAQAPTVARVGNRMIRVQDAALENRQKSWRWILVATLVVLLFETWLAGRTARRVNVQEGTTT